MDSLIISNISDIRYSDEAKELLIQTVQMEHGTEYNLLVEIRTEALQEIILFLKHCALRLGKSIEDLAEPPIVQ